MQSHQVKKFLTLLLARGWDIILSKGAPCTCPFSPTYLLLGHAGSWGGCWKRGWTVLTRVTNPAPSSSTDASGSHSFRNATFLLMPSHIPTSDR